MVVPAPVMLAVVTPETNAIVATLWSLLSNLNPPVPCEVALKVNGASPYALLILAKVMTGVALLMTMF